MAGRSKSVAMERERIAWQMLQELKTQEEIAEYLQVTQGAVSKMLERLEKKLSVRFADRAFAVKLEQTARLEYIAREALRGWVRSQQPMVRDVTAQEEVVLVGVEMPTDADGKIVVGGRPVRVTLPGVKTTTKKTVENQAGNPAFLEQVRGSLADERKLWGLDAPVKQEVTGLDGGEIRIKYTELQLASMDDAELARITLEEIGAL